MALPQSFLDQFDEPFGFMDFASIGAMSIPARAGLAQMADAMSGSRGKLVPMVMDRVETTRGLGARLMGVPPEQVTLVPSTSAGLFAVAYGLAGGTVVVPETEFPANLYPWVRAAEAGRIDLRTFPVPGGRLTADLVAQAVDSGTTAVALSHVDYRTGYRCDLPAIREAAGPALLVVDAVQGLGALTFSMEGVDVMVAGGHKWLRAGGGAGLLAVSERALGRLRPALTGWLGVVDPFDTAAPLPHPPLEGADRFVMGSGSFTAVAALCESLRTLLTVSMEDVEAAVLARSIAVEEEARRAGARVMSPWRKDAERSGIVSFSPARESSEAAYARLVEEGFSLTERNGMLRCAPHASTHPDAPAAVGEILAG
ncbi:MAG: aminotransferase class V-fold PLP-dependent enzyme [bacterium]|nr:aminotransferase class V-fold PLP-dependent enzyme [bacterium]MDE0376449.1 aminotransferase class V-fold PLP-dependent enzyme [bacterium]